MMIQVLSNNMDKNLIQEAIFAVATELNEATTAHWDENSIDVNNTNGLADVINIGNNCESNVSLSNYRLRPGHILQPLHRKCLSDLTVTANHANTNNLIDAVEDNAVTHHIFINPTPSASGYKQDYNSSTSITYNPVFAGSSQTDMKKITTTIFDQSGNTLVSLDAYVANVGEIDYYKRSF